MKENLTPRFDIDFELIALRDRNEN